MNGNGDAWGKHARDFFRNNWFLILALVGVLGWGIRIEANTGDRFTGADARAQKAEILLIMESHVGSIKDDISGVREDIAYIRAKIEHLDAERNDEGDGKAQ